ncbi:MAG: carotenoid 1,2-hydratase [Gammaproteobacteria bacterium]|nr:carotenoid 1,2-hydratase [Gammaproteobacteria bacterium]
MKAVGWTLLAVVAVAVPGCGGEPAGGGADVEDGLQVGRMLGAGNDDAAGYAQASRPRPFRFPEDHGAHPTFRSEWWYLTFALQAVAPPSTRATPANSPTEQEFGVQFTLFRRALFPDGDPADPWRNGQAYLAHFALTDVAAGTHRHAERSARGHPQLAGAEVADGQAAAWLEDWRLVMAPGGWSLRAAADGIAVDLAMRPEKGFVPQGDRGLSAKGVGAASHYYSAPRLRTAGHVEVDGERHPVAGWGWLDREWSTSALGPAQVGWDWFALMLDSGEDVMAFRLRRRDGARDPHDHGALIDPDGAVRFLSASDFKLSPMGHWRDEEGREWPIRWRLALGERRFEIAAALEDQRMDTLLTYWEGLVRVTDAQGRDAGRGYMELTGY